MIGLKACVLSLVISLGYCPTPGLSIELKTFNLSQDLRNRPEYLHP